jgi:hypothetical protein
MLGGGGVDGGARPPRCCCRRQRWPRPTRHAGAAALLALERAAAPCRPQQSTGAPAASCTRRAWRRRPTRRGAGAPPARRASPGGAGWGMVRPARAWPACPAASQPARQPGVAAGAAWGSLPGACLPGGIEAPPTRPAAPAPGRGFNLPARHVIHTVGPIYHNYERQQAEALLASAVRCAPACCAGRGCCGGCARQSCGAGAAGCAPLAWPSSPRAPPAAGSAAAARAAPLTRPVPHRSPRRSSLLLASQAACDSVAFPAISCGVYGYPKPEAAHVRARLPACLPA